MVTDTVGDGYRPPFSAALAAGTAAILVASIKLSGADWSALPVALACSIGAVAATTVYTVHELLRPFCCSFSDLCALLPRAALALAEAAIAIVRRGGTPRFQEWTIAYELFRALSSALGESGGAHIVKPLNVVPLRRVFDTVGAFGQWVSCWQHGTVAESFQHLGLSHIWIKPRHSAGESGADAAASHARRIVVLYYHGGGYALCSPKFYADFGNRLRAQVAAAVAARSTGDSRSGLPPPPVHLLLANYRKIPEHRFPAPVDDALAMYDYVVRDEHVAPSQIVVAGDSAGGGLVVATLLRLRDAQRAMPAAALTICPYVDMLADVAAAEHCFISKSMLAGIRDHCVAAATGPRVGGEKRDTSLREAVTVNADLRGLPPLLILAAEFDILLSQSLGLAATARRCAVDVELDLHARMPHVFCLLPDSTLPNSGAGIASLADFAARRLEALAAARAC
ncbi:hypothetical protein PybrP1_012188 [[Pythium] brassicae (nom. inval.)]|nr:hypothetical protein PybrP1_012188 [[Pythium] brassicae (nom. inval.)]